MIRDDLEEWMAGYPTDPGWKDGSFKGAPVAKFVSDTLPNRMSARLPNPGRYRVKGSAGEGGWTHTPWVAVLDQSVTATVAEGFYVVYLLSHGCERLYLTINQGCTSLKNEVGMANARAELERRAEVMRQRIGKRPTRLKPISMDLNSSVWRADLYASGPVIGACYERGKLPDNADLLADLEDACFQYQFLASGGGWEAEDTLKADADDEGVEGGLDYVKRYRQHRRAERIGAHAKAAKKVHGNRCMGCDQLMSDLYGSIAEGLIEAHHLAPLSDLAEGQEFSYDPKTDFAVLCPTCHRVIHRLDDPSDLIQLRRLFKP